MEQDVPDPQFAAATSRLLRRESLRRATRELNTTFGPGLESMLARISAEVTTEAAAAREVNDHESHAPIVPKRPG